MWQLAREGAVSAAACAMLFNVMVQGCGLQDAGSFAQASRVLQRCSVRSLRVELVLCMGGILCAVPTCISPCAQSQCALHRCTLTATHKHQRGRIFVWAHHMKI